MDGEHTETVGSIARAAGVSTVTVRQYCKEGLLACIRCADGRRLFQPSATQRVRELFEQRMANRGRRRRQA